MKKLLKHAKRISRHAKDHFIPHRGNNHHPHVLKHHVLFGYSLILIFLKTLALAGAIILPSATLKASAITPQNIVTLTNSARTTAGVPSLRANGSLAKAAQAKAEDMLREQYFAHTSPAGLTPWYWIKKMGYNYRYSAENLAVHFTQAEDVQGGWMTSPSHRANIVNPKYTDIGIGIATGMFEGFQTTFVVQMFGRSQTEALAKPASVNPETNEEAENILPAITAKVTPQAKTYRVELTASDVSAVYVQVAEKTASLNRSPGSEEWSGTLPEIKDNSAQGEAVNVIAITKDGSAISENIAWISHKASPDKIFEFNADTHREVTFFGWLKASRLNDAVNRIYVLFLLFVVCSFMLSLAIKFNKQKLSVTAHAILVIGLGFFMYLA